MRFGAGTMSKYPAWICTQDEEFIKEIHGDKQIPQRFKDHEFKAITLEELEQLDNKYILKPSETV